MTGSYIGGHTIIDTTRPKPQKDIFNLKDEILYLKTLCERYAKEKPNKAQTTDLKNTLKHVTYNQGRLELKKGKLEPDNPRVKLAVNILKKQGETLRIYSKLEAKILLEKSIEIESIRQLELQLKAEERRLRRQEAKRKKAAEANKQA